jgi:CubicO group peptidase (beta-lactamase class C family)
MSQFEKLTPLLKGFVEKGPSGCACSVTHKGEMKYMECFGQADLETGRPIAPDTLYRIFSLTKVVTSVAALKLYERGLYLLNDPLEEYLPEFRSPQVYRYTENNKLYTSPAASSIRVKDLFTMTSGLTYDAPDTETGRQIIKALALLKSKEAEGERYDVRTLAKTLASVPLSFDPGTHWRYSMSYDVLAALIEVLSGKKFGRFLKEEIFEPLGMNSTFHHLPDEKRYLLCTLYNRSEDGRMTKNTDFDTHFSPDSLLDEGGSGLITTIGDYGRFAQMLAQSGELNGERILSRKTVQLMSTNHLNAPQLTDYNWGHLAGYGYGLGVRVMIDAAAGGSNSSPGEFGWCGMVGTWALSDSSESLSAVYMQQMIPNFEEIHEPRIRNVIYGAL